MFRYLRIALLGVFVLALLFAGAMLKHSIVNSMSMFTLENARGALPVFGVAVLVALLVAIGVFNSPDESGDDQQK